ncbi:nucleotidyltransferase domain-containing protein [Planosporangium sp. 12N6]|uniref:nucleotidyltransferase domain-containing protein n=1 Tax=Planosporangium spinosum TaxID=3402278 RepID=UPI003CF6EE69
MEPIDAATGLVRQRFPHAVAAFLGGTVLSPARTAMSDLDIVVVRPDGETYRETVRHHGWPVELFVSTLDTYPRFLDREVTARRSPLAHMVGHGAILVDVDGYASRLRAEAVELLRRGPAPVSAEELEDLRYGLSDLLDDLAGATDPDETAAIATLLFTQTAVAALTLRGAWLGTGKWLARQLRTADREVHDALMTAFRAAVAGEKDALARVAGGILDRAGGRLLEGYRREATFGR